MMTNSRSKTMILIAGIAVIALAAILFANALAIGEFTPPGRGFFSGSSNLRLAAAFVLLAGLACALLFQLMRTGWSAPDAAVPAAERRRARTSAPAGTAPALDPSAGILSDTAGELKTSVETIQDELEEILEEEAPADKEHMQSLYDETGRLKKIIAGMEQLSQAQAIARSLKKETIQVEPLLKDIIEKTRQTVTGREVIYTLECEQGLAMQGDHECLSRILGNITDNAARFIRGSGRVTVSAARAGAMMVFSVKDTGTGIRRAHLAHIYERFFRGTGAGIGMGLSIVKELADACGGEIEVRTGAGKGTTFTVRIPGE